MDLVERGPLPGIEGFTCREAASLREGPAEVGV